MNNKETSTSPNIDFQANLDNNLYGFNEKQVIKLASHILEFMNLSDYELSLLLVNGSKIKEFNRDFLR